MQRVGLAGHYGQRVELDLCRRCDLVWFDGTETARLSGPALLELIGAMAASHALPHEMLKRDARCPRCDGALQLVHNQSRWGRSSQLQCQRRHGTYQSFAQFLQEKGLLRPMSRIDRAKLLRDRGGIDCVNCGGAIGKDDAVCPWCRSAPSLLDVARLARALDPLDTIEAPDVYRAAERQGALHCAACGASLPDGETISCRQCGATLAITSLADAHAQVATLAPALRAAAERPSPQVVKRRLEALEADLPRRRAGPPACRPRPTRSAAAPPTKPTGPRCSAAAPSRCAPSSSRSCSGSPGSTGAADHALRRVAAQPSDDGHLVRAGRNRALVDARSARRRAGARAAVPAHRARAPHRQRAVVAARPAVANPRIHPAARHLRAVRLPLPLFVALRTAPPLEANLVNYLWPLLIVVLAPLLLPGVRLRPVHVVAAVAGFSGAALAIVGGRRVSGDLSWGYLAAPARRSSGRLLARHPAVAAFPTRRHRLFGLVSGLLALACHACSSRRSRCRRATGCSSGSSAPAARRRVLLLGRRVEAQRRRRIGLLSYLTPLARRCSSPRPAAGR
jgi:ribosomal protein S26